MTKGKIVRKIKEAPILNELYRIYTEYKVARNYKKKTKSEVFTEINTENKWGGSESVSGVGSDFIQTNTIIKEIPLLFKKLKTKKVLDLPCGDHLWMNEIDFNEIEYIGADIVKPLIEKNKQKYRAKNKSFIVADITQSDLPVADIIIVRDCLVHLSFENIELAFKNLKDSNIKYLLTTTFPETKRNYDITTGNWRPLNLLKAPFHFPNPEILINENCSESYGQYQDKSLGLWEIKNLPIPAISK